MDRFEAENQGRRPLVSVVVPTYNYGRFLPEALESVLAQDYPRMEIVVVDDGSTDETRAIVAPFVDRGVIYVWQENKGRGQARNAGIAASTGPLLAFLDADDVWLPGKLSLQVDHLERTPELAMVSGAYFDCDEENRPRRLVQPPDVEGYMLERLLVKNIVGNPTKVLIRRRCLDAVGGFSELPVSQDWDTYLRIASRFPIGFVRAPVAKKRDHQRRTLSARDRIEINQEIFEQHARQVRPAWKRTLLRRRSRAASCYYAAAARVKRGERRQARKLVLESAWLDPFGQTTEKAVLLLRSALPRRILRLSRPLLRRAASRGR